MQNYTFSSFIIIFRSEGWGLPPAVKPYGVVIQSYKELISLSMYLRGTDL